MKYRPALTAFGCLAATALLLLAVVTCGDDSYGGEPSATVPTPTIGPISAATRSPIQTALPPTPSPIPRIHVDNWPYYPCGPAFFSFDGDVLLSFVHWTKDDLRLIFNSGRSIWILDTAETELRQIAAPYPFKGEFRDWEPLYGFYADLSPDDSQIVYSTCEFPKVDPPKVDDDPKYVFGYNNEDPRDQFGYEIATVNIEDTAQQRLTTNNRLDHFPVWSPDGSRIAFVASPDPESPTRILGNSVLLTISSSGLDLMGGLSPPTGSVALYPPVWSPDGRRIAFTVYEETSLPISRTLFSVQLDGKIKSRIGETSTLPTWSPDGSELAFAGPGPDGESVAIYVVKPDGSEKRIILSDESANTSHIISQVVWSPDGSEILFVLPDGVYAVSPNGQELRTLTEMTTGLARVAWSPDGSRIAIYQLDHALVTMARDGTDQRTLVEIGDDGTPSTP